MAKQPYFSRPLQKRFPSETEKIQQLSAWTLLTREKAPKAVGNARPSPSSGRRVEKLLETSKSQRFLRKKRLPGHESHGPVHRVEKEGASRLVTFRDGTVTRFSTPEFKARFQAALAKYGYKHAVESIRVDPKTGRATATIGGAQKGVDKEYQSVAKANAALKRRYKQK